MWRLLLILTILAVSCKPKISPQTDFIIVPIGDIPNHIVDSVQWYLGEAYEFSPQQITPASLPKSAFVNIKSPRYRADSLLKYLEKIRTTENADFAFGITAQDISTTKRDADGNIKKPESKYRDWGIMGLAYRPGKTAIISTYRLNRNHVEFYNRLRKVCIHELGHNLGLPHCSEKNCVMTDAAESVRTIDRCQPALCNQCAWKKK